jgi:hypothetical protein
VSQFAEPLDQVHEMLPPLALRPSRQSATIPIMAKIVASLFVILLGSMFLGVPAPFTMRVVDDQTGAPVPGLRITTDNGIVCYTQRHGDVRWTEWSLMNRRVRFEVNDRNHRFDPVAVTLGVMYGGQGALKVHRRS